MATGLEIIASMEDALNVALRKIHVFMNFDADVWQKIPEALM